MKKCFPVWRCGITNLPLKMTTTTGFDPSLLRSLPASSGQFKFPTNSPRRKLAPVKPGGKTIKASSLFNPSSSNSDEVSNGNGFSRSYRRIGLIFTATLPFVVPLLHESIGDFGVKAADERLIIQEGLRKVLSKGKAAGVLRLVFHDAGTYDMDENSGGMNGSIVHELDRPENVGLKKSLKILEKAKCEVDTIRSVSWADMISVAGAEAVSVCGGPLSPVSLGRVDSMVPDPEGRLPDESLDATGLKKCFQRKGFSFSMKGTAILYAPPEAIVNQRAEPGQQLVGCFMGPQQQLACMIGLPSDRALVEDDDCLRWITIYSDNQKRFFEDFKDAYTKLVNSGARWKDS